MARLVGYGHAGVEPKYMGIGPVPAVQAGCSSDAELSIYDIDVIEVNEAFAAQALAVQDLDFRPTKANPNGSGISLGHPIGATGAILTIKALYELERIGGRYALVNDVHRRRPGDRGDLRAHLVGSV